MIVHVVGNRPQFIKLAPLYHEIERRGYEQLIIHSGQHYDENMSDVFFDELHIPKPYVNLAIGSGSHAEMTAKAMVGIEEQLNKIKPKMVILYGDTDTTLAAAVATKKLCIPIAHIEGGVRTHSKNNPEECNRIITDHVSDYIFCPDNDSYNNMVNEGLSDKTYVVGDVMFDTYKEVSKHVENTTDEEIILMTWHRQENTCSKERMEAILSLLEKISDNIVCPLHPRTRKCLEQYGLLDRALSIKHLQIIEPVGYVEMVSYMKKAKLILTDSGGLSKESSFAGCKCLLMVDLDLWPDLQGIDWIHKVNPESDDSVNDALSFVEKSKKVDEDAIPRFYGNGDATKEVADILFNEVK